MPISSKEFFDSVAYNWDNMITVESDRIRYILGVAEVKGGDEVLDVGTGTGVLIPYIEEVTHGNVSIDAVDISENMILEAKKKFSGYDNVDFKVMDVETENPTRRYDRIFMYCMLPHLMAPIDTVEWLAKLGLKPGGTLVIAFPESRRSINMIHQHNDGSVHSDHLKEISLLVSELEGRGLNVDFTRDDEEYYILRVRG